MKEDKCITCEDREVVIDRHCMGCWDKMSHERSVKSHAMEFIGIERDEDGVKAVFTYRSGLFDGITILLLKSALKIRIKIRQDHDVPVETELKGMLRLSKVS